MKAMWKQINGVSVFTGIVFPNINDVVEMKYLHDDPLAVDLVNTGGHAMSQREFICSMIFYDGHDQPGNVTYDRVGKNIKYNVKFLAWDLAPDIVKEMNKTMFGPSVESYDGVWYPYQSSMTTSVRTLDTIKVQAISNNGVNGRPETFWVNVVAVSPRGDIIGYSGNDLYNYPINSRDYIVCKIKDVIFVGKGPHWKDVPYGTIIGEQCDNPKCHEWEFGEDTFKSCSRCKHAIYCTPECQRQAWLNGHRQECKKNDTNVRKMSDNPNLPMSGGGKRDPNEKCSCCDNKFSDCLK